MRKKETPVTNQVLRTILKDAAVSPNGVTWILPSHGKAMSLRQGLYVERDRMRRDSNNGQNFATVEQAMEYVAIETLRIVLKPLPDGKEELTLTRDSVDLQSLTSKDPITGAARLTLKELLEPKAPKVDESDPFSGMKVAE